MNFVNSEPLPKGIEENITGLHDGRVEIDDAMSRRPPAMEGSSVKISVSGTNRGEILRDVLGLKHRGGHDNLEDRARGQLPLDGAIQQWSPGIRIERLPFRRGNADGEIVGIECGAADHRQDFPCARIHGDDGAFFVGHVGISNVLQIVVDRQLDRLARNGVLLFEAAHFFANAVDNHAPQTVRTHQGCIVLALQARFPDNVARFQAGIGSLYLLRAYFTHVPDSVGKHIAVRVAAPVNHQHFENGNVDSM